MTDSPGVLFRTAPGRHDAPARTRRLPVGSRADAATSLKPYLIEEAYEVLEAIESGRSAPVREELGDLLFQVVFHARLAEERGEFTMADLLEQLIDKMIRRHPHVFGGRPVGHARRGARPVGSDQAARGRASEASAGRCSTASRARCRRCCAPSAFRRRRRA